MKRNTHWITPDPRKNTTMSQSPSDVTEVYAETVDLSESERHRLLGAERRRVTLGVLMELTVPVDLKYVAARVAARERDTDTTDQETIERVAATLHHVHLPKMANIGVIDYNPERAQVVSCPSRPDS